MPNLRTWSNSTFQNSLDESRSDKDRLDIVDKLFDRYRAFVERDPINHGLDYVHLILELKKRC
jgi:hypothetical protein